jgi:hypothetical protein
MLAGQKKAIFYAFFYMGFLDAIGRYVDQSLKLVSRKPAQSERRE